MVRKVAGSKRHDFAPDDIPVCLTLSQPQSLIVGRKNVKSQKSAILFNLHLVIVTLFLALGTCTKKLSSTVSSFHRYTDSSFS
jgi:hypothetical protein